MITHLPKKLVAERLTVMRGMRCIFHAVSLSAGSGEALILTGANGVGKTTLLRAIAGFLPLRGGDIRLEGTGGDEPLGTFCHYVGHHNGVKRGLTVMETLQFFSAYLGGETMAAGRAAERLGLATLADIPAGYLSAGQQRRLGLARLLCAPRPVWLLDEPAVSLDAPSQALLAGMVNAHLAEGGIVLAATHTGLGWANMTEFNLEAANQETGNQENAMRADAI
jgi:heme exporter protein A